MDGVKYDDENMGVALARRCSTAALLQVLIERADADGDTDATAEELAEVERLRQTMGDDVFAEPARSHAALAELGVSLLPRVVREVVARRVMAHPAPVERTPRVVLEAMLRSYEEHAIRLGVAMWADPDNKALDRRHNVGLGAIGPVRDALVYVLAGRGDPTICLGRESRIGRDYLARLDGSTPLDAPPAEAP